MSIYAQARALHKKHRGKIGLAVKTPIKTRKDLALAYTPGVGEISRAIAANPKAVYEYTGKGNAVAIITDGTAVLGLGDIGPKAALPVMEGKAVLMKEFAGVDAYPICLDTKDTEEIIKIVKAIAPGFGAINLEDISAPRCFEIEERLQKELDIPVFHDDQHGTAIVVLAGLINACKVTKRDLRRARAVISGAGAAGIAISKLLLAYGVSDITLVNSRGIIHKSDKTLNPAQAAIAKRTNPHNLKGSLADALVGADILVGVSAPGIVSAEMIATMARDPIVFALANPTPEIMPSEAKKGGAAIIATGRSDFPNQINNVLVFPGVMKGLLRSRASMVTDAMKLRAARALASYVKKPTFAKIIPDCLDKKVADIVARSVGGKASRK